MNFDRKFSAIQAEVESAVAAYNVARDFTENFLKCCEKHGIKTVSIQKETELIPESKFTFGANGSVFASERDDSGWPAIWGVVNALGISGGCGNSGQKQISNRAMAQLVDGVYQLKDGQWLKID